MVYIELREIQKAGPAPAFCLLTTKTKTTLTNKNNQIND